MRQLREADAVEVTEDLLGEIVRRICEAGDPLKIVLFGSHARGDTHPHSDVDLLIVEESAEPRWERSPKYYGATSGLFPGRDRDIVVWTPEEIWEWQAVPNYFVTTALREGRVLYERPSPGAWPPGQSTAPVRSTGEAASCSGNPGPPGASGERNMKGPADHARQWLLKADSDLANARQTLDGPGPYDTACFHAQQAIEKCLKAVLAYSGDPIPRTHKLEVLAPLVRAAAPGLDLDAERLKKITPYAVKPRYELGFWPGREEAAEAVVAAEEVRDRVRRVLPPEAVPE